MGTFTCLVVGDMHPVPEELAECSKVIDLVVETCEANNIREVWFSGDQHHTHAVMRVEVLHWWKIAIKRLVKAGIKVLFLVGNHDQAVPGSNIHAMVAYQSDPGVCVVDRPLRHPSGVLMMPYFDKQEDFLSALQKLDEGRKPSKVVFCHQTFSGACYENGFFASDGFEPNLVPQELIISGHIHSGQEFGKCWYVGSPRWRSLSDANTDKNVWILEFESDGSLKSREPRSTAGVCRQIRYVEDTPDSPVGLPLDPAISWRIDIKGPPDFVQRRATELKAAGARIRTFPEQISTQGQVRESEGIDKAFKGYMKNFQPKFGTPHEVLLDMAQERLQL